jgi:surface antigen
MRDGGWLLLVSGWLAAALLAAAAAAPAQESPGSAVAAAPAPGAPRSDDQPVREFNDAAGRLCRVYERAVVIGGERQPAFAVVCREANGRWVLSR